MRRGKARATTCALSLCVGAAALSGCGRDEELASTAIVRDAGGDVQVDAPVPKPDAGPVVRTVETRSPFGATEPGNLLVDGDFELTASAGQFGWRAIASGGEAPLARETGGLCRSGLTCGVLDPDVDFLAFAAAPKGKEVEVEVWTKPPVADCEATVISVIDCIGLSVSTLGSVPAVSTEPDAQGWCHHQAVVPPIDVRPCLFVSSVAESGQKTLVDQASLHPAPKSKARALAAGPPTADQHERIARALAVVHRHVPFGRARTSRP